MQNEKAKLIGAGTLSFVVILICLILGIVFRPHPGAKNYLQNETIPTQGSKEESSSTSQSSFPSANQETSSSKATGEKYIVEPGDTLYSISLKFKIDWKRIAEINSISDSTTLRVGQELIIPKE